MKTTVIHGADLLEFQLGIALNLRIRFIESEEGDALPKIKKVYVTPKLVYYLHWLSRTIVYLEHARNDCVVEYKTIPHN